MRCVDHKVHPSKCHELHYPPAAPTNGGPESMRAQAARAHEAEQRARRFAPLWDAIEVERQAREAAGGGPVAPQDALDGLGAGARAEGHVRITDDPPPWHFPRGDGESDDAWRARINSALAVWASRHPEFADLASMQPRNAHPEGEACRCTERSTYLGTISGYQQVNGNGSGSGEHTGLVE